MLGKDDTSVEVTSMDVDETSTEVNEVALVSSEVTEEAADLIVNSGEALPESPNTMKNDKVK